VTTTTDKRIAGLPVERIKRSTLDKLPEYSCSLPTGTIVGKVWKKNLNAFDPAHRGEAPLWVICEYVECALPGQIGIDYRRAEIIDD
jgi:hypothetical protein